MEAKIVLGLLYGDEGKGRTTDYLSGKNKKSVVIRFSGGQQAGHTVIHNGIKHIHSNFGAGTLRNVPTYFSEHTTIYPVTIAEELKILKSKGFDPSLTIHPLAKVTTPFDVFSNTSDRDNLKHGTCGLGVGKTMKRNESPYKLYAIDLLNENIFMSKIISIAEGYYDYDLGVGNDSEMNLSGLNKEQKEEFLEFLDAIQTLSWNIKNYDYLKNYDNLVFEGSQGILLDMDHGVFPNVTYANTTSKNAHEILDKLGVAKRDVYYITRSYLTRHGCGEFKEEALDLINNEEEINIFNQYQKKFKVANINYDLINHALRIDDIYSNSKVTNKNLVVTCLDQLPEFELDQSLIETDFDFVYGSYSPDSKNGSMVISKIKKDLFEYTYDQLKLM